MGEIPATPQATYRLQFNNNFTFADAARIVPYLAMLGVSHVYASPFLKAREGSTHGYDIIDHNAFNPEIGDESAFEAFSDICTEHGLGIILDFVPNHMGIGRDDNRWWLDVLEWGEESPYAGFFDIDWTPAKPELLGKVLIPVLGDHYGRVLEAGELKLAFDAASGSFDVRYHEHRFPVTPGEYERILRAVLRRYRRTHSGGDPARNETLDACEDLSAQFRDVREWSPALRQQSARRLEGDQLKRQLAELVATSPDLAQSIEETIAQLNAPDDPDARRGMHELLEAQHYRLAYWRVAAEEINYRRFFQINELAGIRVELPAVYEETHRLVLDLVRRRRVHGLRIDHVDGLFDPKQYLQRLQESACAALGVEGEEAEENDSPLFWIVVEKILAVHERLREDWPIAGTTGYEFLNRVHGLFVDPAGGAVLERFYERFSGIHIPFGEIAYISRRQVMDAELASELRVLANEYNHLTESSWLTRDYTLVGLRQALREVAACFPVYRTYVDATGASAEDRRHIDWAIAHARRRSLRGDKTVFDFIQAALSTDLSAGGAPISRREVRRLAMKFQQYSGPVAAKGVEDTAFYRYNQLISLNEVGGEPERFGITVSAFHKAMQDVVRRWPDTMLATATHDTKRGEDARVRIDTLSEVPAEWSRRVRRWATLNHRRKVLVNDQMAPSANDEYLFYQALVGCWPAEFHGDSDLDAAMTANLSDRMSAYMTKAVREAKTESSWINPNDEYENALLSLIGRCLDVSRPNPFLADFRAFHRTIAIPGAVSGLAQAAIKLTAPGVPDTYQGCEFWDFSLVDPDNRRPVDFDDRASRLARLSDAFAQRREQLASGLLADWTDGTVKLFVVWRLLALRQALPELFRRGLYAPVEVENEMADHVVAFVRGNGEAQVLTVVPRLAARLCSRVGGWPLGEAAWGDTALTLPVEAVNGSWENVFTGRTIETEAGDRLSLRSLLADFPIAVLVQPSPFAS